uniref:Uncharacterized protein n=1 Tax=Encephalitozoon cuniculi TaxID=6035 RepID=M1K687_ENCCN|nr:hypothetical protein ECU06_0100 [Encephalitozoon cuniculi]
MKISEPPAISKPTRDESELIRMYLKTIICDFKAPMLIAFPILMGLVLKETVKSSLFLRFIIMLLPFSYSALECFLLFRNNLESSYRSELHKMPCSIFNVLLIAFSVISILSIAIFPLSAWSNNDVSSYSMLLPCLIVPLTYMLSISCSLVSGSILFTDTGIDILIDASLLLCTLLLLVFWIIESKYFPYFVFASLILVLIRSFRTRHAPSKENSLPVTAWRVVVFGSILVLSIVIYGSIAYELLDPIHQGWKTIERRIHHL